MARSLFTRDLDLSDRFGYYLLIGIIGSVLLLLDQRTTVFEGLRSNLNEVSASIFIASGETRKRIRSQYTTLQSQAALVERLELLERKNSELQSLSLDRNSTKFDNSELRKQLNLEQRQQTSLLLSEVRAIEYKTFSQSIIISRGAADGVYIGQAVIADGGLVGQVSQVFSRTSRVLMIADASHALPVLLQSNKISVVAEGSGAKGFLTIEGIPSTEKIAINQKVITSGLGNVYPYGYPVGQVITNEIDKDTGLRTLRVAPFININKIKYVFLLFPLVPQNPQERARIPTAPQINGGRP